MAKQRIVVGMSGGVDSSVAALLLKQQGHEVIGVFMKNWEDDDEGCTAEEDAIEARLAADRIGIRFYAFDFVREYWDKVFQEFLKGYAAGVTPNPDILCNKEIKFKCFLEKALELDVSHIATGHYARIREQDGVFRLLKGVDPGKDQSYFLHALGQEALSRTLFPIGGMLKQEIREIARRFDLPNWDRKDSTGICFIGERDFKTFLSSYLGTQPGDIVDEHGNVVGRHDGLMFHTIGQRQGLGIGGPGGPWFVAGKELDTKRLIAVQGKEHPLLFAPALHCDQLTSIDGKPFELPMRLSAKIRYRQKDQSGVLYPGPDGSAYMVFDRPQRAISPGQAIVFYRDESCLGGGVIQSEARDLETLAERVPGLEAPVEM